MHKMLFMFGLRDICNNAITRRDSCIWIEMILYLIQSPVLHVGIHAIQINPCILEGVSELTKKEMFTKLGCYSSRLT